jgi:hypothetical protein
MQFDKLGFSLNTPESCLVLLIFVAFLGYSYFSLIVLLIYTYKKNRLVENIELDES